MRLMLLVLLLAWPLAAQSPVVLQPGQAVTVSAAVVAPDTVRLPAPPPDTIRLPAPPPDTVRACPPGWTCTPPSPPPPPPPPQSTGCVGTTTHLCPGDNLSARVSAAPPGTRFTLGAGVFTGVALSPKSGQTFTGAANFASILEGGRTLTEWTASAGAWWIGGQTQQGPVATPGACQARALGDALDYPRCKYPEQLWRDGTLLRPVASRSAVVPGTWYFDYPADRIYVGDDPSGRLMVTSVTPIAFGGTGAGVAITGIVIRHYAPDFNAGAIDAAPGWTVENNRIVDNANKGLRVEASDRVTIRGNVVSRNGQLGLSASGQAPGFLDGFEVSGNRLDSNNTAGWRRGFAAGAMKITRSRNMLFRGNRAERNAGNGFWWDIDNIGATIASDTARLNDGTGIFYEISWGCRITDAVVEGNGARASDAFQNGAGILISASPDCEVSGSIVAGNAHGILLLSQDRGLGVNGPHLVKNAFVHDNTITMTAGTTGFKGSFQASDVALQWNNRFEGNNYRLTGTANYFSILGGSVTEATWQTIYRHDTTGLFTRE